MSPVLGAKLAALNLGPDAWLDTTSQQYQRLILPSAYQFKTRIRLDVQAP
jgi:hypothetical protein